jgi:hypothetical protein
MRSRYKKQQQTLDALSQGIGAACSEYNKLRSDYTAVFPYRVRPRVPLAKYQDKKWSEPHLLIKMCKFTRISCLSFVNPSASPIHLLSLSCRVHRRRHEVSLLLPRFSSCFLSIAVLFCS